MATRFAVAMAVVGIVLSSIALSNATTGRDRLINSLFLASAVLDLLAAVATWYNNVFMIAVEIRF